jgi:hypothetical protein
MNYNVHDTAQADIYSATGRMAFTQPGLQIGQGIGLDLGAQFIRTRRRPTLPAAPRQHRLRALLWWRAGFIRTRCAVL